MCIYIYIERERERDTCIVYICVYIICTYTHCIYTCLYTYICIYIYILFVFLHALDFASPSNVIIFNSAMLHDLGAEDLTHPPRWDRGDPQGGRSEGRFLKLFVWGPGRGVLHPAGWGVSAHPPLWDQTPAPWGDGFPTDQPPQRPLCSITFVP